MQANTIAIDIAKKVFHLHGVDGSGQVVLRRQLRRAQMLKFFARQPACVVGMEACATAHYWARELAALGHEVRLVAPLRVKAFVARGRKNDARDAAAIWEAMTRPSTHFVAVKSAEQQSALMLHGARRLLVEQQTRLSNAIRAHLAELGVVAATGAAGFKALLAIVAKPADPRLPAVARTALAPLVQQLQDTAARIAEIEREIKAWHASNEASRRLATVPQIGVLIASAFVAHLGERPEDARRFVSGRAFAAWIGLVPAQHSTGGKTRLGPITKAGNRYLRQLLVLAATGMIAQVRKDPARCPQLAALLQRMPARKASVAYANKLARMIWAMLARGKSYRAPQAIPEAAAA